MLRVALATVLLLLVPLVAMQFTDEVRWSVADFVVAGALLFGAGVTYQLLAARTDNLAYRAGVGVAVAAALMLVWANLAVGLIGSEDNPANLMYLGVLAVGIIGALLARFHARGMARALSAMALAQALVALVALGLPSSRPLEIVAVNAFFIALFAGSAYLFRRAFTQ
jgi:hypothetical protein